jgi:hypothetical protein
LFPLTTAALAALWLIWPPLEVMLIACFTVFPADAADTINSSTAIVATSFFIFSYPTQTYWLPIPVAAYSDGCIMWKAAYPDRAEGRRISPATRSMRHHIPTLFAAKSPSPQGDKALFFILP